LVGWAVFAFAHPALGNLDEGLIAYVPFEEGASEVVQDLAVMEQGVVSYGPGRVGQAAVFNGMGWIEVAGDRLGLESWTISFWVKLNRYPSGLCSMVGKRAVPNGSRNGEYNYGVFCQERGLVNAQFTPCATPTEYALNGGSLPLNQWCHIVSTRNAQGECAVYMNGRIMGRSSVRDLPCASTQPLLIGGQSIDPAVPFMGEVDEVRIYEREVDAVMLYQATDCWTPPQASPQSVDPPADMAVTDPPALTIAGGGFIVVDGGTEITVQCLENNTRNSHALFVLIGDEGVEVMGSRVGEAGTLGILPVGTPFRFRLDNLSTGESFYSGSGTHNSDGRIHCQLTATSDSFIWVFGFEDALYPGTVDCGKVVFKINAVTGTAATESSYYDQMGTVPACPQPDLQLPIDLRKMVVRQNLRKDEGRITIHARFEELFDLSDGEVTVRIQLIQDDVPVVEMSGSDTLTLRTYRNRRGFLRRLIYRSW